MFDVRYYIVLYIILLYIIIYYILYYILYIHIYIIYYILLLLYYILYLILYSSLPLIYLLSFSLLSSFLFSSISHSSLISNLSLLLISSSSLPFYSFPTPLPFLFRSIPPIIPSFPIPILSFKVYVSAFGYPYLCSFDLFSSNNLTPHVLSEWMVEVCRFEVCGVRF